MRSTTFEILGMTLMAIITMLTCGGMLTWAYLRETRGSRRKATEGTGAGNAVTAAPTAGSRSTAHESGGELGRGFRSSARRG